MRDGKIWIEEIRKTSRGGALTIYRTNGELPDKAGIKKEITEFSESSRKKLAFYASNAAISWKSMITLTYARNYPACGMVCKRNLNSFLTYARKLLPGVRYLWFLEFQKRGAPHFHILLSENYDKEISVNLAESWINLSTREDDKEDARYMKFIIWFNSDKRKVPGCDGCQFWQSAKSSGGLSHYAVKYATKLDQKTVGKNYVSVGRFWGCSRKLIEYVEVLEFGEFAKQPNVGDVFPNKPLKGIPKYIFGN
jgi:hypothetical protein